MNHSGYQAKRLIQLALPVLIAQVTQTMMGFIDTVMAGRVSAVDMAAVAVGTSLWLPAILFVQGLLMAFTPLFAHYNGANNQKAIQPLAFQGAYLAIIGGIIEPGEDPKVAAVREVKEEMGIECRDLIPLGRYRTDVNRGMGWVNSFVAVNCRDVSGVEAVPRGSGGEATDVGLRRNFAGDPGDDGRVDAGNRTAVAGRSLSRSDRNGAAARCAACDHAGTVDQADAGRPWAFRLYRAVA